MSIDNIMSKTREYFLKMSLQNSNKEIFVLTVVLLFAIICRLLPFEFITSLFISSVFFFGLLHFYVYTNKQARIENKNKNVLEFSWGYVAEKTELLNFNAFVNYLKAKDFTFYKTYFNTFLNKIIILGFIFGDLFLAFKNLDFFYCGIYIALSVFTKFVFLGYLFMRETYIKVLQGDKNTDENVLDIFYSQMNGLISVFVVIFILFFILSKYIVEIFFGSGFLPYQASLPFVLLANTFMVISICVYMTARKINLETTNKIFKVYFIFFAVLFVFMSINYIDTITYFVVGATSILSIFLYNFVIKKPEYILNTYNHLF